MNIEDFAAKFRAEFVSNKLQTILDGKHVELGFINTKNEWELTPAGEALAAQTEELPTKLTRSGKPDARYK